MIGLPIRLSKGKSMINQLRSTNCKSSGSYLFSGHVARQKIYERTILCCACQRPQTMARPTRRRDCCFLAEIMSWSSALRRSTRRAKRNSRRKNCGIHCRREATSLNSICRGKKTPSIVIQEIYFCESLHPTPAIAPSRKSRWNIASGDFRVSAAVQGQTSSFQTKSITLVTWPKQVFCSTQ